MNGQKFSKLKKSKQTGLKVGNRFTEYIRSVWQEVSLFIKILIVVVVVFVLVQATEVISLYINVNSGGIDTTSGIINVFSFFGLLGFLLLLFILIPICFIIALIKIFEPINILLTVIAIVIAITSFGVRSYLHDSLGYKPEPDSLHCVERNMGKVEALKNFGLCLNSLKNDKDFIFTHNWLERNLINLISPLRNSKFVLNANLLNKKPSQLPDNVVVVFESNIPYEGENVGGPNDISTWWHHGKGSLVVFGDGRIEFVKKENFKNLRWQP
jgi:hypothetical protein